MTGAAGLLAAGLLLLCAAGLTGLGRGAAGPTPPVRPGETAADPNPPARPGEALALLSRSQRFALTESARRVLAALPYLLGCAGSACLAVAGGAAVAGHGSVLDLGDLLGFAGVRFAGLAYTVLAVDRLSGLFLLIAFGAAIPVSLGFAGWPAGRGGPAPGYRGLGALHALTLGAIAVIMTARDAFVLLFGWELLTVAFYLLAGFERRKPDRPAEALVTLVFGKISGASLLAGLLLLASRSGSMTLASFGHVPGGAVRSTGYVLLVTGFAVKAGLVPFQVWLPRGYSAAPGPARAVMAGVGSTVGFYGLWRTLGLLGAPPGWLAGVLLVAAAVTAILGIAHAAVATQLPRVIAYSSVENTGLIVAGFGVALTGAATHDSRLVAAGLLAATLQVITHTVAKSVLMLTGARIELAMGTGDLDRLRGAGRRVPWSGTGFAVAALTLAGLPLTAGFVSEWFLLESLMQQSACPGSASGWCSRSPGRRSR
jgi:hydrogenase-4 component B